MEVSVVVDSKDSNITEIDFVIDGLSINAELNGKYSFQVRSYPKPYEVIWDEGLYPIEYLNQVLLENQSNVLLIDANVYNIHKDKIVFPDDRIFIAEATEEFKTINGVLNLIEHLERFDFTKSNKLIAVGGGVIQDVAAFASAIYKRGIPWIFFPTTLLSMCDSCIGAKTGINYNNVKNQLALFSAPSRIIINPKFLRTLNEIEIYSGLGEIIKFHIIAGKLTFDFFNSVINNGKISSLESLKLLIVNSLKIKKAIVEIDEYELNHRRSLNYGHTIGHALEVLSDYQITHGMAIIIGMFVANEISKTKGLLTAHNNNYINKSLIEIFNNNNSYKLHLESVEKLKSLIKKDKKTLGQQVYFAVMTDFGKMQFLPISLEDNVIDSIPELIKNNFNL